MSINMYVNVKYLEENSYLEFLLSKPILWYKNKKGLINKCRLKLFGKQKPKKDYDLTIEAQNKIMGYYKNKNRRFRKAAARFMKLTSI